MKAAIATTLWKTSASANKANGQEPSLLVFFTAKGNLDIVPQKSYNAYIIMYHIMLDEHVKWWNASLSEKYQLFNMNVT